MYVFGLWKETEANVETMHRSQRLTPIFCCKTSPSLNNIVVGHMRIIRSSEFPDLSDQTFFNIHDDCVLETLMLRWLIYQLQYAK